MKVLRTGDAEFSQHTKMLLVGQPGAGKSRFAATAPNPLFANAYGGMMSLSDKAVRYVNVTSEVDMQALKMMLAGWDETTEAHFGGPVETLVVDTLDEFQRILMAERLASQKRTETTPADWGWLGQRMHTIVDALVKLPMNVIFITHLKDVSDGKTGQLFLKPALQGAFGDQVSQYVDFALLVQSRHLATPIELSVELGSEPAVEPGDHVDYRFIRSYSDEMYEWVKDFSGGLPPEMELNFSDDFERFRAYVDTARQQVPPSEDLFETEVTPEVVADLKRESMGVDKFLTSSLQQPAGDVPQYTVNNGNAAAPQQQVAAPEAEPQLPKAEEPAGGAGTGVPCTDCGNEVDSQDYLDLSKIRYRTPLCAGCFTARRS